MKKEYKAPELKIVRTDLENSIMTISDDYAEGKKSGRIYEDEEAAPAATPKGFWDDEN